MVIDMTDTKRIFQVTTILGTLFLIGLILYFLSQGYFTDSTKLQALLNQTGIFAPLLFRKMTSCLGVDPMLCPFDIVKC